MKRRHLVAIALFGVLAALLVGCILVSGGTDDYNNLPRPDAAVIDVSCPEGAALCEQFTCASTADCNPTGAGDGGLLLCCLSLQGTSPLAFGYTCASSCGVTGVQVCGAMTNDCGEAGACALHSCTLQGVKTSENTCTVPPLPGCQ